MDPARYGDEAADIYDWLYGHETEPGDQLAVLRELAKGGPALEIGVGTGLLAIPLAERGTPVTGIDASQSMLDKAQTKIGRLPVELLLQDVVTEPVAGQYPLCFASINTLFMLGDHSAQRTALKNMVGALADDGTLVLETFNAPRDVPPRDRQSIKVSRILPGTAWMELNVYDEESRNFDIANVVFRNGGSEVYTTRMAYWYLDELDALAEESGLSLIERWSDWSRTPFDDSARDAISIYRKQ